MVEEEFCLGFSDPIRRQTAQGCLTALNIIMVTLRPKLVEVRQPVHAGRLKLLGTDLPILVLVHDAKDSADDVVGLLLMRDLVRGLLLRIDMMYTIYCFYFFLVPDAIAVKRVVSLLHARRRILDGPVKVVDVEKTL